MSQATLDRARKKKLDKATKGLYRKKGTTITLTNETNCNINDLFLLARTKRFLLKNPNEKQKGTYTHRRKIQRHHNRDFVSHLQTTDEGDAMGSHGSRKQGQYRT